MSERMSYREWGLAAVVGLACLLLAGAAVASDLKIANVRVTVVEPWDDPAAYLVIQSGAAEVRTLVGVSSPRSESMEIHIFAPGQNRLNYNVLEKMEIPAGGAVAFAPRGLYLSFVEAEEWKAGETVPIVFEFDNGEKITVDAVAQGE